MPGAVTHIPLGDLDPTGGEPFGAVLPRHPAPDQPVRRRALFRGREHLEQRTRQARKDRFLAEIPVGDY